MTLERLVRNYLHKLELESKRAEQTRDYTAELSYRPVLDEFFSELTSFYGDAIGKVYEPNSQGSSGRPDWKFYNLKTLGIYGYVEAKPLDLRNRLSQVAHAGQVNRYLKLGHKLILADGLEFMFFAPGFPRPETIYLAPKPLPEEGWDRLTPGPGLDNAFRAFFRAPAYRRVSEEQLVQEIALRAKEIAAEVAALSDLPESGARTVGERDTISVLNELKGLLQNHHDPTLKSREAFADFVAQVLSFALLYAHRVTRVRGQSPSKRYQQIKSFWAESIDPDSAGEVRPFGVLLRLLNDELQSLGPLGRWYDDCAHLLAHIRLDEAQLDSPDYHKLFERFLEAYDPKVRFDYGAFYTPPELAAFAVDLVMKLVQKELKDRSLYDEGNKLIDPCCGTGTFLEQLVLHSKGKARRPHIAGFEILPAPYALAQLRVRMLESEHGAFPNLTVVLTNTLSDELEESYKDDGEDDLIEFERNSARKLCKPPITLIIGNPPSVDSRPSSEGATFSIIEDLLEDFRPPETDRRGRQNIQKQITNEFVKFLRWSCQKLVLSDAAVLALIVPSSFAEHGSYKYARKWMAEHFGRLWTLDIDMDGRTGVPSSSLFNTRQGRTLIVAMRGFPELGSSTDQVEHASIAYLSKEDKLAYLAEALTKPIASWQTVRIGHSTWGLRPPGRFDSEAYEGFWPLYSMDANPTRDISIFQRKASGVKLAPTAMFVHIKKGLLYRRSREIADESISYEELSRRWFSGQSRPPPAGKFRPSIRQLLARDLQSRNAAPIRDYSYRPFTSAFVLLAQSVLEELQSTSGGGTRPRPELQSAFEDPDTKAMVISPAPKDLGDKLHRFASFVWDLPDNDMVMRGNAMALCTRFPEYKHGPDWDPRPKANVSTMLIDRLNERFPVSDEDVLFYVYSVISSDLFLTEFEDALFTVADETLIPRVPIVDDERLFGDLVGLGRRMALLEGRHDHTDQYRQEYGLEIDDFGMNLESPFAMSSFRIHEERGEIDLLENDRVAASLVGVPQAVLEFRVSGYVVIYQWLKLRAHTYLRAEFDENDANELLLLIARISAQAGLVDQVDQHIRTILSGHLPLVQPPSMQ